MKTGVLDQFINNHLKYFTILYKHYTGRLSSVHISDSFNIPKPLQYERRDEKSG